MDTKSFFKHLGVSILVGLISGAISNALYHSYADVKPEFTFRTLRYLFISSVIAFEIVRILISTALYLRHRHDAARRRYAVAIAESVIISVAFWLVGIVHLIVSEPSGWGSY